MEGAKYPRAIYRDGGADLVWGQPIETSAVRSEEEERDYLRKGWRLHPLTPEPLDHDGDGRKGGSRPRKAKADEQQI